MDVLEKAFTNADIIIHTASLFDIRNFPDNDLMFDINVMGK